MVWTVIIAAAAGLIVGFIVGVMAMCMMFMARDR